ncbi:hypothetical protein EYC84_001731 [Monilinia fructicola]|uniref:Uncharacterized protein n=1 Tax=Monilinia fructicola TaxID=38448 RepID=A0A5M9JV42_MONFR|nr:hypothetical protein EYC84_001731 [Monilinia fructicola]
MCERTWKLQMQIQIQSQSQSQTQIQIKCPVQLPLHLGFTVHAYYYKLFKMGVGRRMKKQGMPEPLDEAHFTNLKRKAGMSVAESRAESLQYAASNKKRRTSDKKDKKSTGATNGKKNSAAQVAAKGKFTNSLPAQKASGKKPKKTASLPTSDDEMGDGDSDAADLMNDEFDDLDWKRRI